MKEMEFDELSAKLRNIIYATPVHCDDLKIWLSHVVTCTYCKGYMFGMMGYELKEGSE